MKHLLFIMFDLGGGGAEKALIELLKAFDYNQYKVSLCLVHYEGVYLREIPTEVNVITLYERRNSFYRKSFRYYQKYHINYLLAFQIRRKVQRHYDAIISFMEGYSLLFHSFIVKRAQKNISWVHCDLFGFHYTKNYFYNQVDEWECYTKMDDLVFVSGNSMSNFSKLYQVGCAKHCLYNIVDVKKINKIADQAVPRSNEFLVVAIGSLSEVKGFDRLIRVAKLFRDSDYSVQFQIIGQGGKENELKRLKDELGLQENVSFLGFKQPPYPYLKVADLLVSTSLSEGLSLVICEAFALGVPVVATKTVGAVELLDSGKYGLLTEHDDLSIYKGIKRLIDDSSLREEYRNKSRLRAEIFNMEQVMQQVYNLFSK